MEPSLLSEKDYLCLIRIRDYRVTSENLPEDVDIKRLKALEDRKLVSHITSDIRAEDRGLIAFRPIRLYSLTPAGDDIASAHEKVIDKRAKRDADNERKRIAEQSDKKSNERRITRRYWFDKLWDLMKLLVGAVLGAFIQYKTAFLTRAFDMILAWFR